MVYFLGPASLNFTGAATHAARSPQRWYPRAFDIYGSRHQIMPILVVCGAVSHTTGLIEALIIGNIQGVTEVGAHVLAFDKQRNVYLGHSNRRYFDFLHRLGFRLGAAQLSLTEVRVKTSTSSCRYQSHAAVWGR